MAKSNSSWAFALGGVKQAVWICAGVLLLGAVGFFGAQIGSGSSMMLVIGGAMAFISGSPLAGPIPLLLTCFDVSDKLLLLLSWVVVLPYWACLGTTIGFIRGKTRVSTPDQQSIAPHKQDLRVIRRTIGIFALAFAVLTFLSGPLWVSDSGGPRLTARIIISHNLRQIETAKQQLALDKKLSDDYVPTEAELAPYLQRDSHSIRKIGSERYVINCIREAPYAVFESDWRLRRHGWQQGCTITNGTVYQLK
jgi:hypothetical protein